MRAIMLVLVFVLSASISIAGLLDSGPDANTLSKIVNVPAAGKTQMTLSDYVAMWKETNPGSKSQWSQKSNKWILTIEYRDRTTMKKQKLIQSFDIDGDNAFLEAMIGEGKELPANVIGSIVMNVWSQSSKGKTALAADNRKNSNAAESVPKVQELDKKQSAVISPKNKEDKTKSEAEASQQKLKSEKIEEFKKKISGAHCGNDSKIVFEDAEVGKVKFTVAGPKCNMKSNEFSVASFTETNSMMIVALAEHCTMQIRPDGQQYKSGRTGIQLGIDCDGSTAQKIFECNYGDLITSWTPCKSIGGWSDLFN